MSNMHIYILWYMCMGNTLKRTLQYVFLHDSQDLSTTKLYVLYKCTYAKKIESPTQVLIRIQVLENNKNQ